MNETGKILQMASGQEFGGRRRDQFQNTFLEFERRDKKIHEELRALYEVRTVHLRYVSTERKI
jgi:hypothetical protein